MTIINTIGRAGCLIARQFISFFEDYDLAGWIFKNITEHRILFLKNTYPKSWHLLLETISADN